MRNHATIGPKSSKCPLREPFKLLYDFARRGRSPSLENPAILENGIVIQKPAERDQYVDQLPEPPELIQVTVARQR